MSIKKAKVGFVALVVAASSFVAITSATTANAAATSQWCKGVKIAAFPGGPQGGVFANNVYNGYVQAAKDLGPTVKYYFSDWDSAKLVTQMKEAVATKPNGMAIYGFGGPDFTSRGINGFIVGFSHRIHLLPRIKDSQVFLQKTK